MRFPDGIDNNNMMNNMMNKIRYRYEHGGGTATAA
jgi:hypothetical protein